MAARRKWDEETIARTLGQVVAELGRMPTRTELERRDLSSLWSAMRRNGGTRVWAARALDEQIRVRAYFLALDGAPGGPEEHWLRAERELAA
jgi:Protein of unknown function (DUF2934)